MTTDVTSSRGHPCAAGAATSQDSSASLRGSLKRGPVHEQIGGASDCGLLPSAGSCRLRRAAFDATRAPSARPGRRPHPECAASGPRACRTGFSRDVPGQHSGVACGVRSAGSPAPARPSRRPVRGRNPLWISPRAARLRRASAPRLCPVGSNPARAERTRASLSGENGGPPISPSSLPSGSPSAASPFSRERAPCCRPRRHPSWRPHCLPLFSGRAAADRDSHPPAGSRRPRPAGRRAGAARPPDSVAELAADRVAPAELDLHVHGLVGPRSVTTAEPDRRRGWWPARLTETR